MTICLFFYYCLFNYTLHNSNVISDRISAQFKTIFVCQFATCLHISFSNAKQTCLTDNMVPNNWNDGELLANFLSPNWAATSNDCNNGVLCDNLYINLTKNIELCKYYNQDYNFNDF